MAGQSHNNNRIIQCILSWKEDVISNEERWKANNLHLDEIEGMDADARTTWVDQSIKLFDLMSLDSLAVSRLRLFLHMELNSSNEVFHQTEITRLWIEKNISDYTPPSLHYCSIDYLNDFYMKELKPMSLMNNELKRKLNNNDITCFKRTYYDEREKLYSRELYFFRLSHASGSIL